VYRDETLGLTINTTVTLTNNTNRWHLQLQRKNYNEVYWRITAKLLGHSTKTTATELSE